MFGFLGVVAGLIVKWLANVLAPERVTNPYRTPVLIVVAGFAFAALPLQFDQATPLLLGLASLYTVVLLLVLVIDFEHRLILNVVILPAILFALLAGPFFLGSFRSLVGGTIAFIIVFGMYLFAQVFARWRGYTLVVPFGFGDVKLATFVGIVTGFPGVFSAILLAILLGGLGAVLYLLYEASVNRRLALGAAIPYGPFFCIAGWVIMFLHM